MVTWDMVQQLVRILMQFVAGALVTNGTLTQEVATQLTGAVLSFAGVLWWVLWEKKRAAELAKK